MNPANWLKDLGNSFLGQFIHSFLYVFSLILQEFLVIINTVMSLAMSTFNSIIIYIVDAAASAGVFGLPIMVIGFTAVVSFGYLSFDLIKDTPVVGAFV